MKQNLGIWFPAIKTGTGTDVFTRRLAKGLNEIGIPAEITWLPLRAEYTPWLVTPPKPPEWATVAHINSWLHPRFAPLHLPMVTTIHHAIHHPDTRSHKGLLRAAYHKYWIAPIERKIIERSCQVIAVSHFVADTTKKTLADIPLQVIYNGIDKNIFKPANQMQPRKNTFQLLYVGSWITRKGVDLLAPIMRELGEQFELLYTGGLASEKDKPYMPSNMIDIGRLDGDRAVAMVMQQADALLFPSRSEGHPLVAIEALACGLTVIAMEGTSVEEVIDEKTNGFLCKKNDIQSFVECIRNLAEDKRSKGTMMQKLKIFSEEDMIQEYIKIYLKI